MTYPRRHTFWLKTGLTLGPIALSDLLIKDVIPGAACGVLSLALVGALMVARPAVLHPALSRIWAFPSPGRCWPPAMRPSILTRRWRAPASWSPCRAPTRPSRITGPASILHRTNRSVCIPMVEGGHMDKTSIPAPAGCLIALEGRGEVWSWRLTTPEGAHVGGFAPDPATARRSAAFAAFAVTALSRIGRRRF